MSAPSHKIVGIAIVLVAVAFGFSLMGRDDPPPPEVRKAQSPATIERDLREGEVLTGPRDTPFSLRHPERWAVLEDDEIPEGDPQPAAGLRRNDSSGLLTVSVRGPVEGGIASMEKTLADDLERRIDDFRLTAIRRVRVAAGPALYASFVRERSGQIQTMLVIPEGNRRSYQIDAAIRPEAQDTAAEVGAMLRTFDIAGR
jgi:hypothetical protein